MKSPPRKIETRIRELARSGMAPRKIAKKLGVNLAVVRDAVSSRA